MTASGQGSPRGGWVALIAAWGVALVALAAWLARTPPLVLREELRVLQFWSLEICLVAAIGCALLIARDLRQQIDRRDVLRMGVLAAITVGLTVFVAPRTHRIFYDEQIYQSIGHNLADLRLAQMCLDGNVEYGRLQCTASEYNKQPYAYPHLLSVVYRIGGAGPGWAFAVNVAANALTVAAVYLLVLMLFRDAVAAFFAGLILALIPHQLLWSATAAVEPLASLAAVAAAAAMAHFGRTRSTRALLAAGVAAAYAIQFRPESFLILVVLLVLLAHLAPEEFTEPRLWWVGLLCLALVSVHLAHLFAVRNEGWGTTEARFSLQHVLPNFRVNGRFYVTDERFPVAYTLLALGGLFSAGFALRRLAMLLYFLAFFVTGLLFYAGSYNYGADVRYSLMTYPPLAVLAGLGAAQLARQIGRWPSPLRARRLVAAGLVFQFLWYVPLVRATTEEAWAARTDVEFAQRVAADLPANAYVLTHNPGMFHLWGVNAGQMFLTADNPARLHYLTGRYAGGVYLHWNFWCNVADKTQQDLCRTVSEMVPSEVFREHREQDQRFSFRRLTPGQKPDARLGGPPNGH